MNILIDLLHFYISPINNDMSLILASQQSQ